MLRPVLSLLFLAGLVACASPLVSNWSPGSPGDGISYFLPRQMLKLTVTRTDKTQRAQYIAILKAEKAAAEKALEPIDKSIADLQKLRERLKLAPGAKAQEAIKAVDARVEEASTAMTAQKAAIDKKAKEIKETEEKAAEDKKNADESVVDAVRKAVEKAKKEGKDEKQAAEEARKTAELANKAAVECSDSISLSVLPPEPDPELRYMAVLGHSWSRDDKWTIATTPAGLLSSADVVLTDRSADIVVELVRSAALVAKALSTVGMSSLLPELPGQRITPPCVPFRREHIFDPDPARPDERTRANALLVTWDVDASIKVEPVDSIARSADVTGGPATNVEGLFYRRPIPYSISIKSRTDDSLIQETRVALPNGAPIDLLPVPDPWLVTVKQSMKFDQGMLTSVESDQPSQLIELARFPGRVAKEVISIPAEILQLKIDYSSKEAAEINADKAILDAQKSLLESRDALDTLIEQQATDRQHQGDASRSRINGRCWRPWNSSPPRR